jgi:hypothetical protein
MAMKTTRRVDGTSSSDLRKATPHKVLRKVVQAIWILMNLVLACMFYRDGFSSVSYQSINFKHFAVGCSRKSVLFLSSISLCYVPKMLYVR